jgi:CheY-like chemotaxis protein
MLCSANSRSEPPKKATGDSPTRGEGTGRGESGQPGATLAGRRVLVVEDEAMISALIEMILGEAGCSIVGPVATVQRALEIIESESFDAALLDVHVNGRDVYAVADVLSRRGIPFVLVSGFARRQLPPRYGDRPYVAKPFSPDTILTALDDAVADRNL